MDHIPLQCSAAARPPAVSAWPARLALIAVLCCFCLPLFVSLRGQDLGSDETIYSYAVDRILETGEWLTPRLIPYDGPFLEKPPLKFWMVAGAMRVGLLPHDELGFRFIDALFGAVAFVYVFQLGRWLAGPICGFVAVLVLFTFEPLLLGHGLRSNNMEAALFLSYCAGMYHFARWVEGGSTERQSLHALAVAAYFTLGFMTKFVAVLFLPLVCAVALAWRDGASQRVRPGWRDWVLPVLLVCAVPAPWFIYEAMHLGMELWHTMFAVHVYTRFVGTLDPGHLHPWHYYYTQLWDELRYAGSEWLAVAALVVVGVKAWSGRPWLARLLIVWWLVPFVLMSIGTSKVSYYMYPFLPPIGLGVGVVADALFRLIGRSGNTMLAGCGRLCPPVVAEWLSRSWPVVRRVLALVAVVALVLGVGTAIAGQIRLEIRGVELLRNSAVARPIFIATVLIGLCGYLPLITPALAVTMMAIFSMLLSYPRIIEHVTSTDHPLRALRDCAATARKSPPMETHVYPPYEGLMNHSYYYYLRQVGPWVEHHGRPGSDELQRHLYAPGPQNLVIVSRSDYQTFVGQVVSDTASAARPPAALSLTNNIVLMAPGPFESCAAAAVEAGGRAVAR